MNPPSKAILRRCIACRQLENRETFVRVTHNRLTNKVDVTLPDTKRASSSGRSAYICMMEPCIRQSLKGNKLQKALKTSIPSDILRCLGSLLEGALLDGSTQSTGL